MALGLAAFGVGFAHPTASGLRTDRDRVKYTSQIRKDYNFRFGKGSPFLPSNAQIEGNQFIPPGSFPTAGYCGHCHSTIYQEWQQSAHSNSFRAPFYLKNVTHLIDTKGIEYSRYCEGCHNPISLFSGALTKESRVDREFDKDGITCSVCHSIQSLQANYGVGSYEMGIPAVMVDEYGKPIPGTVPYEEILAHPDRHSKAVMKDLYKTPELCGACHKANIPRSLNEYKWVRSDTLYDEWQASSFSKQSPLPFYESDRATCQTCHMAREAAKSEYGAKDGTLASHRWLGGNTAIPFYYGFDNQTSKTIEFLKNRRLTVDIFGLRKGNSGGTIAPIGLTVFRLTANDMIQVVVVIQNKSIGHSLIPEQRNLYEAWVEFLAKDAEGRDIYHSGYVKPDGALDKDAHGFTNRIVDGSGKLLTKNEAWMRRAVAYDNTIPADSSTLVRYEFHIPVDAKGPLTLTARVNYRRFNQSYLDYVLGQGHLANPVAEMAAQSRLINLGENEASPPDPRDNPEWMRWNDFGIALLGQKRYTEARHAFAEVVRLRPDYADGFTNIALADIRREQYGLALASLHKSLELIPGNPRALYYRALAQRGEGHLDAAIVDLQEVVEQFPRFADAHREMGISYYLTHGDERARQEFEAVQAIDPDDLPAHYYLSFLYRRLGSSAKADEQGALYFGKKDDPSALTTSEIFLREHPEAARESVLWHIHSDRNESDRAGATTHSQ